MMMMGDEVMQFPSLSHSQLESLGESERLGTGLTLMMMRSCNVISCHDLS